jgi:hypothetical protein
MFTCHILLTILAFDPDMGIGDRSLAAQQLADQTKLLQNIYCSFEQSETPTPEFVALELAASKKKRSPAEIEKQYGHKNTKFTFVERRDQLYYLRTLKEVDDTNTAYIDERILFDGKVSWRWKKVGFKDGTDSTNAVKGTDPKGRLQQTRNALLTGIITRKFLGASLLKGNGTLIQQVLENSSTKVLPDEDVDGEPCSVMQLVEITGTYGRRLTLWLDGNKQYVLRKLHEEYRPPKSPDWFLFIEIITTKISSTVLAAQGQPNTVVSFPSEIRELTYNSDGVCTFKGHTRVTDYRFNVDLATIEFTPRIEDGTNYFDAATGKSTVFGGGPSPRIKAMIRRRVEQSRGQLKGLGEVDLTKTQSPPGTWADAIPWAAAGLGLTGLLVAATGRRLFVRSKD